MRLPLGVSRGPVFPERWLGALRADPHVANATYEQVLNEMRLLNSLDAFEKFCEKGSLPDVEASTLAEFREQLDGTFGAGNVVVTPQADGTAVAVEISLPDHIVNQIVKVTAPGAEDEKTEAPFVPFPVALDADPELVFLLARRENLGPDEAVRALSNIEEEFWATKKGQVLQREGVERSFAEFISNVPSAALAESGIKRYHKDPETLRTVQHIPF